MRLRAWRKTKVLPSGIQVGGPANPAPPRPPPRPPALRDSSVIGCFWAKAEAARRRRMPNFVMVAIVAIRWRRFTAEFNATEELRGGRGWATRKNAPKNGGRPEGTRPERLRYGAAKESTSCGEVSGENAEEEAGMQPSETVMNVPHDLAPKVRGRGRRSAPGMCIIIYTDTHSCGRTS